MKRVMITGIGGGIGMHMLAHICHNTDWEIVGIDSFKHRGYFDRITEVTRDHQEWLSRIAIYQHDLVAPFTHREMEKMGPIDYIINLASLSDVQASIDDPVPFVSNNVALMLNMLQYARVVKPRTFIHFSTDEVYGPTSKNGTHKEWDTILPSNPYAASKAAQEAIAISYWRSYNVPIIITNTMNNFGETQSSSKFPAMVQNKLQKGEKVQIHTSKDGKIGSRYYIHSRNAADAVLFLLQFDYASLHVPGSNDMPKRYNIVGDKQIDNLQLAHLIAKLMNKELEYELVNFHDSNPGHDLNYGLSGSKLKALGWKSPLDFETSMKNTIDWQKEHAEWLN